MSGDIERATEDAKAILEELADLRTDEGANRAELAVLNYFASNPRIWDEDHPDGGSMARMAAAGDRRSHEIMQNIWPDERRSLFN
jgi:hypothetical protein